MPKLFPGLNRHQILVVVLAASVLILFAYLYLSRTVNNIARQVIDGSMVLTQKQLSYFFHPIEQQLRQVHAWGEEGLLDDLDAQKLNQLFVPLLSNNEQISSLLIANSRGDEYMLLQRGRDRWQNRLTRSGSEVELPVIQRFTRSVNQLETRYTDSSAYDPRQRPWYQGAIDSDRPQNPHWTQPYLLYTTREPGVSAAMRWESAQGITYVVAFDVLLKDISRFTSQLDFPAISRGFVMSDSLKMIGLPADEHYLDSLKLKEDLLKPVQTVATAYLGEAVRIWSERNQQTGPFTFSYGREAWWGQIEVFPLDSDDHLYYGAVVEKPDLLTRLYRAQDVVYLSMAFLLILLLLLGYLYRQEGRANRHLREAYQALEAAQEQLIQSEKMASMGRLIAGIAHEINNPVNFIVSSIYPLRRDLERLEKLLDQYRELIQNRNDVEATAVAHQMEQAIDADQLKAEVRELLDGMEEGAGRTEQVVAGLRTFSRLEAGEFGKVNLHELLERNLKLLESHWQGRITIEKQFAADLPEINGDPAGLSRALYNLLENAVEAIEGEGKIELKTRVNDERVEISIRDSGRGIPDEMQGNVFDPFYSTKAIGEGQGMGLAITYTIVLQHQGSLRLKSKTGEGSTFTVSLPVELSPRDYVAEMESVEKPGEIL